MSEALTDLRHELRQQPLQQQFDETLAHLAGLAIRHDELSDEAEQIPFYGRGHQFTELLNQVDTSLPPTEQPEGLAYAALAVHIAQVRLEEIEQQQLDLRAEVLIPASVFQGKRVKISKAYPEASPIGTSQLNKYGNWDGLSQWHDSVQGRISNIHLLPEAAWISIEEGDRCYSTTNLLNRFEGYRPNYTVQFLNPQRLSRPHSLVQWLRGQRS